MKCLIGWLMIISLVCCRPGNTTVPFCGFAQLSKGVVKEPGTEIPVRPVLVQTELLDLFEPDSFAYFKTWHLNEQYHIAHKAPSYMARLLQSAVNDTLIIHHQSFDIGEIIENGFVAIVKSVRYYHFNKQDYLIFKVLDGGSGRIISCYLLAFNITDSNHVICINQRSHVAGRTWMVKENLITDLDHDGYPELNLIDSLGVHPYIVYPEKLVPSSKHLFFTQVDNERFNIHVKQSDWYFKIDQRKDTCDFDFDEELPPSAYDE